MHPKQSDDRRALTYRRLAKNFVLVALAYALTPSGWAYGEMQEPQLGSQSNFPGTVAHTSGQQRAFSRQTVLDQALALSKTPFKQPQSIGAQLDSLDYDTYRQIRYRKEEAIWAKSRTPFSVELFPPGFLYKDLIDVFIVENSKARLLTIDADSFSVPDPALSGELVGAAKFAGFRLHFPINTKDYGDEFAVFQGASYFRAVSQNQIYGLSARGLALDIGERAGEEFPVFRAFWIERPSADARAIVIHALLDSKSVTGAYRFGVYPGDPTWMEVSASLFPRSDLRHVGLAPLTSMFMFSPIDPSDALDHRPAVHDSKGLAIARSNQEQVWRPLANPKALQLSAFTDTNPQGYGLVQRTREFAQFQDLEARYELRPSAWVQPLGDWGKGHVQLVEIPSDFEGNDNIVAYWRPQKVLRAGERFDYRYRLSWPDGAQRRNTGSRVVRSALGRKLNSDLLELVIDYSPATSVEFDALTVRASASAGSIVETILQPNSHTRGGRLFIIFDPEGERLIEFRAQLMQDARPIGETWLYRWTSG